MNVLVFNCGSSSLKFKLIAMPGEVELAAGECQRIGPPTAEPARIVYRIGGAPSTRFVPMDSHPSAFREVMDLLNAQPDCIPQALGHRIAHGGRRFTRHAIVDDRVLADLVAIQDLAPLHNPPATTLVAACRQIYPALPQVLVFDTVYHATIPDYARTYALPGPLRRQLGLHKYGFHGTSHQFVAQEAAKMLGRPIGELNAVSCHLGSGGASLCAIVNGRSVDNSMGYSTLQGLVMSTRCGDLDPVVTLRMLAGALGDGGSIEPLLSRRSGVLGLSGISGDIRDVLDRAGGLTAGCGDERMRRAAQIYLWRIRKYLGAYMAVVSRPHAVIFTDTIGELVPEVRWAVCCGMESFGLRIDAGCNAAAKEPPADVAAGDSAVRILVIATNEELSIARFTYRLLTAQPAAATV